MNEDQAKETLRREGYQKIYTWFDSPDTAYEPHVHHRDTTYLVIQGSMQVNIGETDHQLSDGSRLDIPKEVMHDTRFGPDGCTYVVGEKSSHET